MKPRLLDLFCGAGGAARGYQLAGFHVTGVDLNPQSRYAGDAFHQADAMTFPLDGFDVVHASPPCQDHSPLRSRAGEQGTGWMLDATRQRLIAWGGLWVMENVMGAEMRGDIVLCGGMFGLRTYRHRKFELSSLISLIPQTSHPPHRARTSTKKRRRDFAAGMHISVTGDVGSWVGPAVMGIDWMTGNELSQAIPPAYTEHVGQFLMAELTAAVSS